MSMQAQVGKRGMPINAALQQAAQALATPKPPAQKGPSQRNKQVRAWIPHLHSSAYIHRCLHLCCRAPRSCTKAGPYVASE